MSVSAVSGYPTACTTISCIYCKAVLAFQGLPAVRYADHLSNEHRILFQQDDVIMDTINQEYPGLLPPHKIKCHCSNKSMVKCEKSDHGEKTTDMKLEADQKLGLVNQRIDVKKETAEGRAAVKSASSQTSSTMIDAMCQTVEAMKSSLLMLDASVQTISTVMEEDIEKKPNTEEEFNKETEKMSIEEQHNEKGEGESKAGERKIKRLLASASQGKVGDEYPCAVCKKMFSSLFNVKTHITVAHDQFLKQAKVHPALRPQTSSTGTCVKTIKKRKGFKSKTAYLKQKKFTNRKQRPWCKYCWIRFPNRLKYEEHRKSVHSQATNQREDIQKSEETAITPTKPELSTVIPQPDGEDDLSSRSPSCTSSSLSRANTPAVYNADVGGAPEEDMEVDAELPNNLGHLVEECLDSSRKWNIKLLNVGRVLNLTEHKQVDIMPATDSDLSPLETETECTEFSATLPWYEASNHHCLICERFYALGTFNGHVVETHGVSMVRYREQFPSDDLKAEVWSCSLCEKTVNWTQPSIARHLKAIHSLSIQEYGVTVLNHPADAPAPTKQRWIAGKLPWYEARSTSCGLCSRVFIQSQLRKHVRLRHSCSWTAYVLMFPPSKSRVAAPHWKCLICSTKLSWTQDTIQAHLQEKHGYSLTRYEAEYVEKVTEEKQETAPSIAATVGAQSHQEGAASKTSRRPFKHEARSSESKTGSQVKDITKDSEDRLWVPWYESKLHKCLLCGELRTCGLSFKNHIYDKHQFMSRRQYVQKFPRADIEPKQWNCTLCVNTVKWTKKCILDHLKSAHNMSKEDYESTFEMSGQHQVEANDGGDFNARTDLAAANKETMRKIPSTGWKCGLCDEEVASLVSHITEYHKMNKVSYLKICPKDAYVLFPRKPSKTAPPTPAPPSVSIPPPPSDWACKICEKKLDNRPDLIKDHLDLHAIDIKDYGKTFGGKEPSSETKGEKENEKEEEDSKDGILPEAALQVKLEVEDECIKSSAVVKIKKEAGGGLEVEEAGGGLEEEEPVGGQKPAAIAATVQHRGSSETPWYEYIKITCRECRNSFWLGQFMKHIILTHKLPIKVYKAKYPDTDIPKQQYTCRMCGNKISHYASPISGHLTGRHNITMTEYYEKYEKNKVEPPVVPEPVPHMPDPVLEKKQQLQSSSLPLPTETSAPGDDQNPNMKNQRMAEFQKSGKIPWYESKTTTCRFCNEEWLLGSFRRHLYDRHDKVSRTAYAEMYPDADISIPSWTCKICGSGIKWVRDNIFYHLRTHNYTMEGYRQIYIDGNGPPAEATPTCKQMPSLVPIPKDKVKQEKQFRCKLCGTLVAFESESIKTHLKTFHAMSISDYQPVSHIRAMGSNQDFTSILSEDYGGAGGTTAVGGEPPPPPPYGFGGMLRGMLQPPPQLTRAPDPPAVKPPMPSGTPWYNRCKWTCCVCQKAFSSGFWRHVQESHNITKEDYIKQNGKTGIEIVHYFCKICNKKVPWSGASINAHTKAEHSLTLKEYEQSYGPDTEPEPTPTVVVPPPVPELTGGGGGVQMPQYNNLLSHQLNLQRSQINFVHSSSKWFNGCEYKCQLCYRTLHSVAGLSMHLKDTHMMDKFSYFRQFGRTGINIKKYRCKICMKTFPWSGVSISKHVKQAHQISLQKYSSLYENGSTQDSMHSSPIVPGMMGLEPSPEPPTTLTAKDKTAMKWYNKCSWTCQICGNTVNSNSSAFYKHVTQDHSVPIDEYKEKYGNAGFAYVDHTCKLCQKKVPCNGLSMCKHFKHTHQMQLEEYEQLYMQDDDGTSTGEYYEPTDEFWYNKCLWKCLICGNKNKSLGSSKKHIHRVHSLPYEDYVQKYGTDGITEVNFKCRICKSSMSCNGVTIASHLLNNHKLTIGDYEKSYLSASGTEDQVEGQEEEEEQQLQQQQQQSQSVVQEPEHFLFAKSLTPNSSGEPRKEKQWYQKCKYYCQICNNPYFSISALRNHTRVKHNMDRDTYVGIYGVNAGREIEDYECKICHRILKCEGRSLNAHMRNCHKMGILEYSNKYESQRGTNEDPNYYNEHYQIEMENDEGEEEEPQHDNDTLESIGIDEDEEEGMEDPLANFGSHPQDMNEDEYEDMTIEESMHFNFQEEDITHHEEDDEGEARDLKPDISKLYVEPYEDSMDEQVGDHSKLQDEDSVDGVGAFHVNSGLNDDDSINEAVGGNSQLHDDDSIDEAAVGVNLKFRGEPIDDSLDESVGGGGKSHDEDSMNLADNIGDNPKLQGEDSVNEVDGGNESKLQDGPHDDSMDEAGNGDNGGCEFVEEQAIEITSLQGSADDNVLEDSVDSAPEEQQEQNLPE